MPQSFQCLLQDNIIQGSVFLPYELIQDDAINASAIKLIKRSEPNLSPSFVGIDRVDIKLEDSVHVFLRRRCEN